MLKEGRPLGGWVVNPSDSFLGKVETLLAPDRKDGDGSVVKKALRIGAQKESG